MIPPTSIDGTDITGATIDGTDVQEINVDGQTVFTAGGPMIDNFEDTPDGIYGPSDDLTTYYNGDFGPFSRTTSDSFEGSFSVRGQADGGNQRLIQSTSLNANPARGDTFSIRHKQIGGTLPRGGVFFGGDGTSGFSTADGYILAVFGDQSNFAYAFFEVDNGSLNILVAPSGNTPVNEWIRFVVDWGTNNVISFDIEDESGNVLFSDSVSDSTYSSNTGFGLYFNGAAGTTADMFWDDAKIL